MKLCNQSPPKAVLEEHYETEGNEEHEEGILCCIPQAQLSTPFRGNINVQIWNNDS